MRNVSVLRGVGGVVALSFVAVACGGGAPVPPPKPPAPVVAKKAPEPVREKIAPRTCAARTKLAKLLGHADAPPPAVLAEVEQAEEVPPPPPSAAPNTRGASNQAYRAIAPATVLVRADKGFGTGVVIDPKGYVLTNYHVVADGRKKDFVITVDVTFGDLTSTGRMNRQTKSYEAEVVKVDPVRDLAIIKVKEPPPKLVAAKLAKGSPQIAERVMSVGHAGIGFLWAAKACSVASVGERQQDSSIIAGMDCSHPDPALPPDQAKRQKVACEDQKKRMTEALSSKTQGLAVQTDCAITHGDSGGPLVNMAGEIVGLNQSITVDAATASFHVHLEELREFTTKYGDAAIAVLPDPYCDGGFDPTLEDLDLDGVKESLVAKGGGGLFGGYDRMSLLINLDQSKVQPGMDPAAGFDAEVAMLTNRDGTYVWYDTDGDSTFDVLVFDKDSDGVPETAYRIDASGRIREDKEVLPGHDLSGKLVKEPALRARLGKIALAIGGSKFVSERTLAAANAQEQTVPDPFTAAGTDGRAVDTDGNGKGDVALVRGAFSRVSLIDADERSLGALKPGDSAESLLKAKKVDAEIAIVVQGSTVWALYDTNADAKFDLALTSKGTDGLVATGAFRIGDGGKLTPAADQLGRKLLRPGLIGMPRAVSALRSLSTDIAPDEALGSLPAVVPERAVFRPKELKGVAANTVAEAFAFPWVVQLFDVDKSTKLPPKTELREVVTGGKFDAEVAVVKRLGTDGATTWVYYDTDNDGKYDLVLFLPPDAKAPTQAYRVVKKDAGFALEVDASALAGAPIRHKTIFKDKALGAKWKTIAAATFKPEYVEP